MARHGRLGGARQARAGTGWLGQEGMAGESGRGEVCNAAAWQATRVAAGRGRAWRGKAPHGRQGLARCGRRASTWQAWAGEGRQGQSGQAAQGVVSTGRTRMDWKDSRERPALGACTTGEPSDGEADHLPALHRVRIPEGPFNSGTAARSKRWIPMSSSRWNCRRDGVR